MLAEQFDAFLLDLDGVVYLGEEPLSGAVESLRRLREDGKALRFLTNDPRPTRSEVARRLQDIGVEASAEEVITSGRATAERLRKEGIDTAHVLGSASLTSEIREAGIEVVADTQPEAVVVGAEESTSYADIQRAARLVHAGAMFVATNPDGSFPTPEGPSPAAGAIAAAVAAGSGRQPGITAGKPHPAMYETALEGLPARPERVAVIGDNPYTDILGAHRTGLTALLVSSEPASFPSIGDHRAADATIADLQDLFVPGLTARQWNEPSFPWPNGVKAGVAAVVLDWRGRVLLVKRMDNSLWGLPSGHVEPGETVAEAVAREVLEETNVEVGVERLIGVYSEPASQAIRYPTDEVIQFVTSCFLCTISGGELRADGSEVSEAGFFERRELPEELMTMHPRWLDDALASNAPAFIR